MKKMLSMLMLLCLVLQIIQPAFAALPQDAQKNKTMQSITLSKNGGRVCAASDAANLMQREPDAPKVSENNSEAKDFPTMFAFEESGLYWETIKTWISFSAGNPAIVEIKSPPTDDVYASEYFDGTLYGVVKKDLEDGSHYYFGTIDTETYVFTSIVETELTQEMAYDYSTNTMFAVCMQKLVTVDLTTGAFTEVGTVAMQDTPIALAITTEGLMYAVEILSGDFYSIDKTSGAATLIGNTGYRPDFIQSATFDHSSQTMYYALYDPSFVGRLCAMDLNTGRARVINVIDERGAAEATGLHIRIPKNSAVVPEKVPVTGIEVNSENAKIILGKTFNYDVTVYPTDAYVNRTVSWTSSNQSAVTISASGLMSAVGLGVSTISVTSEDGSFTKSWEITVISQEDSINYVNEAASSDKEVLSFTNHEEYPFEIAIEDGRYCVSNTNEFTHQEATIFSLELDVVGGSKVNFDWKTDLGYGYGDEFLFKPIEPDGHFWNGNFLWGSTSWNSGEYYFPRTGKYTLTWEYENLTAPPAFGYTSKVYIDNVRVTMAEGVPATALEVLDQHNYLYIGDDGRLNPIFVPDNAEFSNVLYTSSDPNIANVDEHGAILATGAGETSIEARIEGTDLVAFSEIHVQEKVDCIPYSELDYSATIGTGTYISRIGKCTSTRAILPVSELESFSGKEAYCLGFSTELNKEAGYQIAFSASGNNAMSALFIMNENFEVIGTLTWAEMRFLAPADGTYYFLLASLDEGWDPAATVQLDITESKYIHVDGLSFEADSTVATVDRIASTPEYTITPNDAENKNVIFSSSDENIFKVDEKTGNIWGVSEGTATFTITSEDGGFTDTIEVTVKNAAPIEDDGKLYAYKAIYAYGLGQTSGFVSIDKEDPSIFTVEGFTDTESIPNGTYYNGIIYAFEGYHPILAAPVYEAFDAVTFELITMAPIQNFNKLGNMTIDYTTKTTFITYIDFEIDFGMCKLGTVDLLTGNVTPVAQTLNAAEENITFISITCDNDGVLYGLSNLGGFYRIDKENGACELVKQYEGYQFANHASTMVYDANDDVIYQAIQKPDFASIMLTIDRNSGEIISEDILGGGLEWMTCMFTKAGEALSPTPTIIPTPTPTIIPTPTPTPTIIPTPTPTSTPIEFELGDVNMDNELNSGDAALILSYAAGLATFSDEQMLLGDYNEDMFVNTGDAALILNFLVFTKK
ncbi:MAG: Ig-like domain-containing protein [Clostridia bacterium]